VVAVEAGVVSTFSPARDPERGDAEILQIRELLFDARPVAACQWPGAVKSTL